MAFRRTTSSIDEKRKQRELSCAEDGILAWIIGGEEEGAESGDGDGILLGTEGWKGEVPMATMLQSVPKWWVRVRWIEKTPVHLLRIAIT